MKLVPRIVHKPWGRTDLIEPFLVTNGTRVGEICFEAPDGSDLALLVKFLFTSEELSIQVHPGDEAARARGYPHGKTEAWYIIQAERGARLGLGLTEATDRDTLKAVARDGSIEKMIDRKQVKPGNFFYVPAGTIHTIGGGISLIEFQQNLNVTYRLYDHGRSRDLHLTDGADVAFAGPWRRNDDERDLGDGNILLKGGPPFSLMLVETLTPELYRLLARDRWVVPLEGKVRSGDVEGGFGDCLYLHADEPLEAIGSAKMLVSWTEV